MKIEKNMAVTVRYTVADSLGKVLDKSDALMVYLHGGYGNIFAKIEAVLEGQSTGFQTKVELQPADAFGERDEGLLLSIPKTQFPPGVKVGGELQRRNDDGEEQTFLVVKIKGDTVMLDGNHPMAGKVLNFSLAVTNVRAASEEEIAHGHVHGAHGHQH